MQSVSKICTPSIPMRWCGRISRPWLPVSHQQPDISMVLCRTVQDSTCMAAIRVVQTVSLQRVTRMAWQQPARLTRISSLCLSASFPFDPYLLENSTFLSPWRTNTSTSTPASSVIILVREKICKLHPIRLISRNLAKQYVIWSWMIPQFPFHFKVCKVNSPTKF